MVISGSKTTGIQTLSKNQVDNLQNMSLVYEICSSLKTISPQQVPATSGAGTSRGAFGDAMQRADVHSRKERANKITSLTF